MKNWLIGALAVAVLATAAVPTVSEAKRLGGGKSAGMTRNMPARTAPDAVPAKPAQPSAAPTNAPNSAAAPAAAGAAGAAAAAPKRNWMGPIAGLAAGLGIAALMSHLGMGEAFGNFLMMALLAVAAVFLVRFLMRRFGSSKGTPALAGAGPMGTKGGAQVAWPQNTERSNLDAGSATPSAATVGRTDPTLAPAAAAADVAPVAEPETTVNAQAPTAAAVGKAFVPAAFDSETFTRTAKMIFIRLQTANDTADLDDLRRFTTPELFASLRLDIQDRGPQPQTTDVQKVDAEVLDVAQEGADQLVSVRFTGLVVEEKGAAAVPFNEVWHLVKPLDDSRAWAIAGIEQMG